LNGVFFSVIAVLIFTTIIGSSYAQQPTISSEGQKILENYDNYKQTGVTSIPSKSQSSSSSQSLQSSSLPAIDIGTIDVKPILEIFIFIIFIVIIAGIAKSIRSRFKRKRGRKYFSSEVQDRTYHKQGGRCNGNDCGKKIGVVVRGKMINFEYDHKDGKRWNISEANCQALCLDCHAEKTKREKREKAMRAH